MTSMLGRWAPWYDRIPRGAAPMPYGDSDSYRLGANWLTSCSLVEDWGSGTGWLRTLIPLERYRGLDGTDNPFADAVVDLTTYRADPPVPGLFMRHVLEHNWAWQQVLDNALASFAERMVLILFSPMAEATRPIPDLDGAGGVEVPVMSFAHDDLTGRFGDEVRWGFQDIVSPQTWFRAERIYFLERGRPSG
jgi:hypothetical protein